MKNIIITISKPTTLENLLRSEKETNGVLVHHF
jgi:hypothetical protein